MMKKISVLLVALLTGMATASAGGLMTNTNYHIAFDRMMARGASMEIDAAYSNPAGLAWGHQGWQLSLNFQKPWQNRDIETTVNDFLMPGNTLKEKYNGKASAPIVPALFASYVKDRWAVSAMIGIVGSGGFVEYDEGVPMFNVPITAKLASQGALPGSYALSSQMKGKQYIYGGQVNVGYQITDFLSAAVGLRANYYDGYYKGHVVADAGSVKLINLQLDCPQTGWGVAPIVSLCLNEGPLTVAARYEFRTKISTTNDTEQLIIGQMGTDTDVKKLAKTMGTEATVAALTPSLGDMAKEITAYLPDEKTRYDMPAMLSVAIGYEFTDKLRATAEYHFFDDKNAKMAGNRQDYLSGGTNEFLLGAEYDINDKWTVSLGGQRTDYGLDDRYQKNTSFACDSYSIGLGGALNLTEKIRLNAGYFMTIYSDYTKHQDQYQGTPFKGTDVYSRTNYVIGLGVDYKF